MNRFAALLDRLAYEPRRNAKLRLMADYFAHTPDPERGWALAAITGVLSFRHAKPGLIRGLAEERTDPTLFYLSWDYVGDLSETVALMWPGRLSAGGGDRVAPEARPGEGVRRQGGACSAPPPPCGEDRLGRRPSEKGVAGHGAPCRRGTQSLSAAGAGPDGSPGPCPCG